MKVDGDKFNESGVTFLRDFDACGVQDGDGADDNINKIDLM